MAAVLAAVLLQREAVTLQTSESIYNNVTLNEGCEGINLRYQRPANIPVGIVDIGVIFSKKQTDDCEIIAVTTKDKVLID